MGGGDWSDVESLEGEIYIRNAQHQRRQVQSTGRSGEVCLEGVSGSDPNPEPVQAGSVIRCRPVGVLKMTDEAGEDAKILAVPHDKLTKLYSHVKTLQDLPEILLLQIAHFFEHYKDLEKGKWVKVEGWGDLEAARKEILDAAERYNSAK